MSALPPPPPSQPNYGGYQAPGAVSYGGPDRTGYVQPLDGLSLAASIALGVMAALSLLCVFAFVNRANVLDDFLNNGGFDFGSLRDLDDADGFVAVAVIVNFVGTLATAGVFIAWQFRHAKNAQAIAGRSGLGPEWAIAGWFIPCANLVLPGIELYGSSRGSDPALHPQAPRSHGKGSTLVVVWAVVFGLASVLFGVGRSWFPDEDEVAADIDRAQDGVRADNLSAGSFLLMLVAAVLAIVMVRTVTKRQAARVAALTASGVIGYQSYPGHLGYGSPYPGAPGSAYPGAGVPGQSFPAGPGSAYPGSPGAGYPGSSGSAYPGSSGSGYPGSSGSGYPGSSGPAYPGSPGSADPDRPGGGWPPPEPGSS
jgi:Domain of unknown function (DUF4328)